MRPSLIPPPINAKNLLYWRRLERHLAAYDSLLRTRLVVFLLHYIALFLLSTVPSQQGRWLRLATMAAMPLVVCLDLALMSTVHRYAQVPHTVSKQFPVTISRLFLLLAALTEFTAAILYFFPGVIEKRASQEILFLLKPVFVFALGNSLMLVSLALLVPSLRSTAAYVESRLSLSRVNVSRSSAWLALGAMLGFGTIYLWSPIALSLPILLAVGSISFALVLVASAQHVGLVRHVCLAIRSQVREARYDSTHEWEEIAQI